MCSHASTKIDQKEYLKKYLSGDKVKKKKKDKKHKKEATAKVKVIDDDTSTFLGDRHEIDEELLLGGEDAPQIVGEYIEDRANGSKAPKWRSIAVKEEQVDNLGNTSAFEVKQEPNESDIWGRRAVSTKIKGDFSSTHRKPKLQQTPDNSPLRRDQNGRFNTGLSPLRKKARSPAPTKGRSRSAEHQRREKSDESPPRRSKYSPGKSKRQSHSSDWSPVRGRRKELLPCIRRNQRDRSLTSDQNPPRLRRNSVNSDQSPPRRHRKSADSDQSPPRYRRKNIYLDQTPSRHGRRETEKPRKQTPPQHRRQRSPHQLQCKRRDSDQSPPRKRRDSDQSPPRKRTSPICIKREKRTPDQSSPRRSAVAKEEHSVASLRRSRWEQRDNDSPPPTHKPKANKTLDGKKAGLQDAQALKAETEERRQQEDRLYARMSGDMSGRDAEVQVRSTWRRGRRARDAQVEDPEVQLRKEEREQQKKKLYDRWGKGLKQIEAHRERLQEQEYEGSKPLARYSNDADLDLHLREQERADDPMLEYMRQKRKERQTERNVPTVPVYEGSFPENRFGIRPGYRWDGVDRSNGYEKRWFDKQNEQRAVQDEAYKYSVEDM